MTHILKPTVGSLFGSWGPSHRVLRKYVIKIVTCGQHSDLILKGAPARLLNHDPGLSPRGSCQGSRLSQQQWCNCPSSPEPSDGVREAHVLSPLAPRREVLLGSLGWAFWGEQGHAQCSWGKWRRGDSSSWGHLRARREHHFPRASVFLVIK